MCVALDATFVAVAPRCRLRDTRPCRGTGLDGGAGATTDSVCRVAPEAMRQRWLRCVRSGSRHTNKSA
eukprot:2279505-Pleurochrysis_carterae.AAC.1